MKSAAIIWAACCVSVFAADGQSPRWLNFEEMRQGKEVKDSLEFEILETSQGVDGSTLHTIYIVKAIIVHSSVKGLEAGTPFEAGFDRFYSIFGPQDTHPLKKKDRVSLLVASFSDDTLVCAMKEKKPANQAPEPIPPRRDGSS